MSKIWFQPYSIEEINVFFNKYLSGLLEIRATEIGDNSITATMPVTDNVKQPHGILHGGASVVLAESLGSIASNLVVDPDRYRGVGLEVNANHIRPVSSGIITANCSPIHIGRSTHIWEIKMYDRFDKLNCISRLTVAIVPK